MKILKLPNNKFIKLLINIGLIVGWFFLINEIYYQVYKWLVFDVGTKLANDIAGIMLLGFGEICWLKLVIHFSFWLLITRYIWFQKSRNRIFYGLFDKFKINFKKFEPRIYTTTSNADELKKYAELRDQGIITEEEFQSKKKKLLDL